MTRLPRSIFSLTLVVFLSAISVWPKSAPVKFQMTLLSLYRGSDVIFVGRYDKKEDYGTNRVADGYTVVSTKTYFDVTSVLKGSPRKFVVLDDEEYRYQIEPRSGGEAPRQAVFVQDIENFDADKQPQPGDTVLVFLKQDGDSLVLTDYRDGLKKLSPADEGIFVSRINELNDLAGDKANGSTIAAWLIRCAEQPATRWDGAHELVQGFRRLDWQQKSGPRDDEHLDPSVSAADGLDAAQALTDQQKSALMQILLYPDFPTAGQKSPGLSDGNRELIALVKRWDPSFVVTCLIAQLRSKALSYEANAGVMAIVSEFVADRQVKVLARRYADLSSLDGEAPTRTETGRSQTVADSRARTLATFILLANNSQTISSQK